MITVVAVHLRPQDLAIDENMTATLLSSRDVIEKDQTVMMIVNNRIDGQRIGGQRVDGQRVNDNGYIVRVIVKENIARVGCR